MRRHDRVHILGVLFALLLAGTLSTPTSYASAKTAAWTTLVNYQNVGSKSAKLLIKFFPEDSAPQNGIAYRPSVDLPPNASVQLPLTAVVNGRRGSVIITSDQPLATTVSQYSLDSSVRARPIFPGFRTRDTAEVYLLPTVIGLAYNTTSIVSIQNVEPFAIDATIQFYRASDGTLAGSRTIRIPAASSKYIDMSLTSDTGLSSSQFDGSARIKATYAGNTNVSARIVAASVEYSTTGTTAAAFEGVPLIKAGRPVYMPTALCQKFGADTYYAVQNSSSTSNTNITVTYRNIDGSIKATDGPYALGPGQKKSIVTCSPSTGTNMANFTGSATIDSTVAPIVVLGKAATSVVAPAAGGLHMTTIFYGEIQGYSKLALPFIRWADDAEFNSSTGAKQRTFIAIQNLGNSAITVNVRYWDNTGSLKATHQLTIAAMSKVNSDPSVAGALTGNRFGYYSSGPEGGSVTVEAASPSSAKFIAIVRCSHPDYAEDYNGIPVDS